MSSSSSRAPKSQLVGASSRAALWLDPLDARTVCSGPCVTCLSLASLFSFPIHLFALTRSLEFSHCHLVPPSVRGRSRCAAAVRAAMSSSARLSAEQRRSVEVSRNGTGEPPAMRYSSTSKKSGLLLKRGKFLHRDGMFLLHKKSRYLVLEGPKLSCYKKVGGWGVSSCRRDDSERRVFGCAATL